MESERGMGREREIRNSGREMGDRRKDEFNRTYNSNNSL